MFINLLVNLNFLSRDNIFKYNSTHFTKVQGSINTYARKHITNKTEPKDLTRLFIDIYRLFKKI